MMDPWYTQRESAVGGSEMVGGIDYRSGAGGSKSSRVASLPGRQVEL